jgi:hypothetical protein
VAVWTAQQLAAFLTTVADDRLHPMWWLIALRGLCRGEAADCAGSSLLLTVPGIA